MDQAAKCSFPQRIPACDLLLGHMSKGEIETCLQMQVAHSERVAWIEVVINRRAIAESLNRSVFFENPIGDSGPLATEQQIMSTDEAAGEEVLALGGGMPNGANANQLAVVVVAIVQALLGQGRFPTMRSCHHCDSND